MTNEQINEAIAEECGWEDIAFNRGWIKAGDGKTQCVIHNYCNDLNAMHKAQKTLKLGMRSRYDAELFMLAERDHCFIWETTARQRAEAFLKTIGNWEGAK